MKIGTCCQIGRNENGVFTKLPYMHIAPMRVHHANNIPNSSFARDVMNPNKRAKSFWLTNVYNEYVAQNHDESVLIFKKIQNVALTNCSNLLNMLTEVASWEPELRFFRVSSELLPLFDHPDFSHYYTKGLLKDIESILVQCRVVIVEAGIRVSTHPGAWNILNTSNEKTVHNTIECLLYHKWFMERLSSPQEGAVINIHANGELRSIPSFKQLVELDLDEWLSFENDDMSAKGTTELTLELCKMYGIRMVFDVHHHYVQTGVHLNPEHELVRDILTTWPEGVRPKMHFSQQSTPDATGKRQLAAHSDFIDDRKLINLIGLYLEDFDIMVEAKFKNVASQHILKELI